MKKKILICGLGSIGTRHLTNLLNLGYKDIILYRNTNKNLRKLNDFPIYLNLDQALEQKPNVAFICNPTSLHVETSLKCVEKNCHLFIEKPISNNNTNKELLLKKVQEKNIKTMIGYMMRFHPALIKIKSLLETNEIGEIISFRSIWGEYLPSWHKNENYKSSYAASIKLGGGPALTLSHEIDTSIWLFGNISNVLCMKNFNSNLGIDTEHAIDYSLKFEKNITGNIHLNFYQNPPKRILEINGNNGYIEFNYYQNKILLYKKDKKTKIINYNSFERNQMFVDEIKAFFKCIDRDLMSPNDIKNSYKVLDVILKANSN